MPRPPPPALHAHARLAPSWLGEEGERRLRVRSTEQSIKLVLLLVLVHRERNASPPPAHLVNPKILPRKEVRSGALAVRALLSICANSLKPP